MSEIFYTNDGSQPVANCRGDEEVVGWKVRVYGEQVDEIVGNYRGRMYSYLRLWHRWILRTKSRGLLDQQHNVQRKWKGSTCWTVVGNMFTCDRFICVYHVYVSVVWNVENIFQVSIIPNWRKYKSFEDRAVQWIFRNFIFREYSEN